MELVIRPAKMNDVKEIWDLLHSNSIAWTDTKIIAELSGLWVMLNDVKILGVLYGEFGRGTKKVNWVAIHPIYTEKQLREAMINAVCGVLKLNGEAKELMLGKYRLISELG
jgi:N-acetylglutamate synthase-like GNAT family acetyltransferase